MQIIKGFFLVVVISMSLALQTMAGVPPVISYQGKLMQPSGAAVPDGAHSIQFAIYDAPIGGATLWSETNPSVQTKDGLFSVLLGSVINLPANIFDNPDRWFGVKVGSDPEMTPRQKVASVGYAVKAGSADIAATVPDASITTSKVALGAITVDRLAPGVAIPPGTILMWSGAVNQIPQGWALCDGTNGTPDLRDRFVVGAGNEYAVGATGGEKFHQLTVAEMPAHSHTGTTSTAGEHTHQSRSPYDSVGLAYGGMGEGMYRIVDWSTSPAGNHSHTFTSNDTGGNQPHENRPPYYALCFIMKMGY